VAPVNEAKAHFAWRFETFTNGRLVVPVAAIAYRGFHRRFEMWDDARRKAGLTGGLVGAALGKNVTPYA
jgi:hypothetical protein